MAGSLPTGGPEMPTPLVRSLVAVVDDDPSVRESIPDLLREFGFAAQAFPSAEQFLESDCVGTTDCLVLDMAMPGMTGLELQQELSRRPRQVPIVFITAQWDETLRPRVLRLGASDCLFKPFRGAELIGAIRAALAKT
jgi:FixJ family two-component response regulator